MNLYHKNLKDLKGLYRFIRLKKFYEFLKIHSKLQVLVKKIMNNDEVFFLNLLIAKLIIALCSPILTLLTIVFSHSHFWI